MNDELTNTLKEHESCGAPKVAEITGRQMAVERIEVAKERFFPLGNERGGRCGEESSFQFEEMTRCAGYSM